MLVDKVQSNSVGGIENLASLVEIEITVEILAKYDHGSKIEAACRDAISRHPTSQAMHADSCKAVTSSMKIDLW